ncbi:RNA-directed DNA polymerase from mobile element jockey [Caerostris extrusa]|uniref:RNA-directed DNA polymerase from mobile element jockey n=1 Tax=Caerostris extrusa TaxID=172846 RepID=A0AAV4MGA6_CAEEX|nr:RNA-directed DNA polymerase from mobile element jockey [Caerostris extrusa]
MELILSACLVSAQSRHDSHWIKSAPFAPQALPELTFRRFTLDTEISKNINRLCEKGRKRLQLLKYISGRDWGADAGTLKITYIALIRLILEYGYQIYQVAASTNLKTRENTI